MLRMKQGRGSGQKAPSCPKPFARCLPPVSCWRSLAEVQREIGFYEN